MKASLLRPLLQVKEVLSGARVSLMYYIYGKSKTGEVPRAVPIKVEENAVVKSLRCLANHGYGTPKRIGLVLEHKYNPRVFSSEGLKGTRSEWCAGVPIDYHSPRL